MAQICSEVIVSKDRRSPSPNRLCGTPQRKDLFPIFTGAADTDDALQRRKERYRQELQEQIAEQQRNKKR